ncbi:MAG TPA: adenylate/guanylate cyclase domain-containing protein [Gaiellaceae bacterium]|nr:adenylate/guanylate cyclase domain-containing protein [Gaiellaceae bacterium]
MQRKVVTVLFCDLVGSTALGESTDPEALRARMQRYFADVQAVVERHGGVVEKFVGDAVMAVFGIPAAHEDDALRALRAAWEMQEPIARHGLEARTGVNTGEVVVGDEQTLVTGDAVNVAARLEQTAASGEILIGAQTRLLARDAIDAEPVDALDLKGKSEPVEAYRLLGVHAEAQAIARRLETPLVGRRRERERLWRDYEDVVADRACHLFTLLGPAGVGKSRLVADFLARAGAEADTLRGRCLPYGEGITYWPVAEILSSLAIDPGTVIGSSPADTQVGFRRLLEERAVVRPQIVVLDDLQWAEPTFLDLVEHVADLSRGAPIFVLCIARTELLDVRAGWGGGKLNASTLLLEPLDEADRGVLIETLVGGATVADELRERIAHASEGNPLFVEEMLAMVRERGEVAVPPTIQALLQARLDALEHDLRLVLERGAVEGEVFHRAAITELLDGEDLEAPLDTLVRKDLIRPEPGGDAYRFRHVLIREAAYAGMGKEVRAGLHERFADWVDREAFGTFDLDEIVGYHLERAALLRSELGEDAGEIARRAARRLIAAGNASFERADAHASASLLRRGAALLPGDDPGRLRALPKLGWALMRDGAFDESRAVLEDAIEAARGRDRGAEGYALLVLGDLRSRTDPDLDVEESLAMAEQLVPELEALGDSETLAVARHAIGTVLFTIGRAAEGEALLERAAATAREAGDGYSEREALVSRLRPVLWGPRPAREGLEICETVLSRRDIPLTARALAGHTRAALAAMTGDGEFARRSANEAIALIEESGLQYRRGLASIDIAYAYAILGDLDSAEHELRAGNDVLLRVGETGTRSSVTSLLAEVLLRKGEIDEAATLAEEARMLANELDLDAQPRWRTVLGRVLAMRGDHEQGERLVREAVALAEGTDFLAVQAETYGALGAVLLLGGRTEEAAAAVERAAAIHEAKGDVVSAARLRGGEAVVS